MTAFGRFHSKVTVPSLSIFDFSIDLAQALNGIDLASEGRAKV